MGGKSPFLILCVYFTRILTVYPVGMGAYELFDLGNEKKTILHLQLPTNCLNKELE